MRVGLGIICQAGEGSTFPVRDEVSGIVGVGYHRSPYPSCYNFVEFFLRCSCIKSCTLVVTFSLTNSPGLVFFRPQVPPGLLSI